MNRIYYLLVLLFSSSILAQKIPDRPSPARFVNDFADVIPPQEEAILEQRLSKYADSTSTQMVIVTVASLDGYAVEEYSYKIASTWGIGQKGKNNGLLIFAAMQDRKSRIEVGYGLEGVVTDIQSKHILTDVLKPRFKEGNYAAGFNDATNVLMQMMAGTYKRDGSETDKYSKGGGGSFWIVVIVLGAIILVVVVSSRGGNSGGGTTFYSGGYYYGGSGGSSSYDSGSSFDFGGGSFGGGGSSGDW